MTHVVSRILDISANYGTNAAYVTLLGSKQYLWRLFAKADIDFSTKYEKAWLATMMKQVKADMMKTDAVSLRIGQSMFDASRKYKMPKTKSWL